MMAAELDRHLWLCVLVATVLGACTERAAQPEEQAAPPSSTTPTSATATDPADPGTPADPRGPSDPSGTAGESASIAGSPATTREPTPASPTTVPATEPVIPEPSAECPELVSGTVTLLGLSIEVLAGTPSPTPGPMLFVWHGTGSNGREAIELLDPAMKSELVAMGGLIVAPNGGEEAREGVAIAPGLGAWYSSDFALADELLACAAKQGRIDPRRVYTTGCMAGGLMAGAFTLERSSYVAAAAIFSGGLTTADAWKLQDPAHVPAVMTLYGDTDILIFGIAMSSVHLDDAITAAGGFAVHCMHGLGHCNPSPELHQAVWQFLKAHPFDVGASPYASRLPAGFPDSCEVVSAP